jgi:hypothetical protein
MPKEIPEYNLDYILKSGAHAGKTIRYCIKNHIRYVIICLNMKFFTLSGDAQSYFQTEYKEKFDLDAFGDD